MSDNIENYIQTQWANEMCPIIDGVLFDSGKIITVELSNFQSSTGLEFNVRPIGETTLESFLSFNQEYWTYITELDSYTDSELNIRAVCGEGGMGSDGFVANCRASDNHLNWIVFVQSSNPFIKVEINGDNIVAATNLNFSWSLSILSPEQIIVKNLDKF